MGWVDADAHVVESPLTWDYLTPAEKKFRPQLFKPEDDNQKAHWVIDGKTWPRGGMTWRASWWVTRRRPWRRTSGR